MLRRLAIVTAIACGIHACSSFGTNTDTPETPTSDGGSEAGVDAASAPDAASSDAAVDADVDAGIARTCTSFAKLCDHFDDGMLVATQWKSLEQQTTAMTLIDADKNVQVAFGSPGMPRVWLQVDQAATLRKSVSFGATIRVIDTTPGDYVELFGIEALESKRQYQIRLDSNELRYAEYKDSDVEKKTLKTLPLNTDVRIDVLLEILPVRRVIVRVDDVPRVDVVHGWVTSAADTVRVVMGAYATNINNTFAYRFDDVFYDEK